MSEAPSPSPSSCIPRNCGKPNGLFVCLHGYVGLCRGKPLSRNTAIKADGGRLIWVLGSSSLLIRWPNYSFLPVLGVLSSLQGMDELCFLKLSALPLRSQQQLSRCSVLGCRSVLGLLDPCSFHTVLCSSLFPVLPCGLNPSQFGGQLPPPPNQWKPFCCCSSAGCYARLFFSPFPL